MNKYRGALTVQPAGTEKNGHNGVGPKAPEPARCDLSVKGMHCASCSARVEKALKETPGVRDAAVNLLAERASVTYAPDKVRPEDLVAVIERTGYAGHLLDREVE